MTRQTRTIVVIAVVVAVAVGYFIFVNMPRVFDVEGTITWIDPEKNEASIEFLASWSGKIHEITGRVPTDCEILLNGEPATLADLEAGDSAKVKAEYVRKTKTIRPLRVQVTRPAGSTPTPAPDSP